MPSSRAVWHVAYIRPLFRLAVAFAFVVLVGGCAHLDAFTDRATGYNTQVADVQDQTLLLNIMRSANRVPIHFTELTTLSGTSTFSGTSALSLPFSGFHGGSGTLSLAPGVTASQSPTFNVAVLETQEFYQGILKPLTLGQMSLYINEGLQPSLIFNLVTGEILFTDGPGSKRQKFQNNFHPVYCRSGDPNAKGENCLQSNATFAPYPTLEQYRFANVMQALLDRGLRIESLPGSRVGPPFAKEAFKDSGSVKDLDSAGLEVVEIDRSVCASRSRNCPGGIDALPKDEQAILRANKPDPIYYRVQQKAPSYRLCFDAPPEELQGSYIPDASHQRLEDRIAHAQIRVEMMCHSRYAGNSILAPKCPTGLAEPYSLRWPGAEPLGSGSAGNSRSVESAEPLVTEQPESTRPGSTLEFVDIPAPAIGKRMCVSSKLPKSQFSLELQPRSTQEVVYALGEIARCQLHLDPKVGCRAGDPLIQRERDAKADAESPILRDTLFRVRTTEELPLPSQAARSPSGAKTDYIHVSAHYGSQDYFVVMDPSGSDRSGQVLSIVSQLLALNRSAKDFPTPSVIPLLTP